MGLVTMLNGNVPMENLPSAEDMGDVDENGSNGPAAYGEILGDSDEAELERSIAAWAESQYQEACGKTVIRRASFDSMLADAFGDVPINDNTSLSAMVTPYAGNKSRRLALMVSARVIPDREQMNFFTLGPGFDHNTTANPDSIRAGMRDAIVAERFVQEGLRVGGFADSIDRLLPTFFLTGNSVATWEWIQEWTCDYEDGNDMAMGLPDEEAAEVGGDEGLEGLDDAGLDDEIDPDAMYDDESVLFSDDGGQQIADAEEVEEGERAVLVRQFPKLRVIDLRNWMPCSLFCAEGGESLDWYCEYDTTTWLHLRSNRINSETGVGCYANTEAFTYDSEADVSPFAEDMWDTMSYRVAANTSTVRLDGWAWLDRGFTIHRRVGPLRAEQVCASYRANRNGKLPSRRVWNNVLRKFNPEAEYRGNGANRLNRVKWWLLEVSGSNGVLVRMQPYPYYKGRLNPIEHMRWMLDDGMTYGRGMYANGVSVMQTAANYLQHIEMDASEYALKPAMAVCEDDFDGRWMQLRQGGAYNLPPGTVIKVQPGTDKAQLMVPILKPDPSDIEQVRIGRASLEASIDQNTTVNRAVEGSQANNSTATQSIQDANFSLAPMEHEATRWSAFLGKLIGKLGLIIDEYGTESVAALISSSAKREALAAYDDEFAEQIKQMNEMMGARIDSVGALYATMSNAGFFGSMVVECMGPLMGGGAAARAQSLIGFLDAAMKVETVSPGIANYRAILERLATDLKLPRAETLLNDEQQQQMQAAGNADLKAMEQLANASLGMKGAGGAGGGAGEASPPADRGSAIPQGAMGGMI